MLPVQNYSDCDLKSKRSQVLFTFAMKNVFQLPSKRFQDVGHLIITSVQGPHGSLFPFPKTTLYSEKALLATNVQVLGSYR